ncbi:MAG: DUF1214 domain-containing protein [Xanthobacteraceae bacterium]
MLGIEKSLVQTSADRPSTIVTSESCMSIRDLPGGSSSSHHDGSLTIYIQTDGPGADRQANWLPAPKEGGFKLALRLFARRSEVSDGT